MFLDVIYVYALELLRITSSKASEVWIFILSDDYCFIITIIVHGGLHVIITQTPPPLREAQK